MPTPDLRKQERKKFDRHVTYVYLHVGVWFVALGIVLSDTPTSSAVSALAWDTQQLLGACMLIGSLSALIGIVMGGRWFRRDTVEHPLDLRYPYAFGLGGLMGVGISMWAYFFVIATNASVVGTLGGGLSLAFGCMSIHLGIKFAHQILVRTRVRNDLTRRALRERGGEP